MTIERVAEAYAAAVYDKDERALLALYDADVFVFDAWDQWSHRGRDAWATVVRSWFGLLGEERVRVTFTPEHQLVEGDLATWSATVRYAGLSASGEQLRFLENRHSWTLRKREGRWLIVHEHFSAPADFKTQKVKLRRPE